MTPVDGIGPPKSKKNIPTNIKKDEKNIPEKKPIQKKEKSLQTNNNNEHKHRLVWLLSIVIVVLIFFGWLAMFQGPKLSSSSDNSFLARISNNFDSIWKSLKKDILKINNETEIKNTNKAEQQLQELEEKVFPEFIESN